MMTASSLSTGSKPSRFSTDSSLCRVGSFGILFEVLFSASHRLSDDCRLGGDRRLRRRILALSATISNSSSSGIDGST